MICLKKQRSKSGYESEVTVYECEDCTGCPYIEKTQSRMSGLEAICLILKRVHKYKEKPYAY